MNAKEYPKEAVDTLPQGWKIVGWGGGNENQLFHKRDVLAIAWRKGHWDKGNGEFYCGAAEDMIFAVKE